MAELERPIELGPHEGIWRDSHGKPWFVKATFGLVGERMEVVGLEVRSVRVPEDHGRLDDHLPEAMSGAGAAINSKVWRSAGALIAEMRRHYVDALNQSGLMNRPGNEEAAAKWLAPKARSAAALEDLVVIYDAAVEAGESTTLAVSKHFGISPAAAAKRIQRAREKAPQLPQAGRGRPARLQR